MPGRGCSASRPARPRPPATSCRGGGGRLVCARRRRWAGSRCRVRGSLVSFLAELVFVPWIAHRRRVLAVRPVERARFEQGAGRRSDCLRLCGRLAGSTRPGPPGATAVHFRRRRPGQPLNVLLTNLDAGPETRRASRPGGCTGYATTTPASCWPVASISGRRQSISATQPGDHAADLRR